MLGPVDPRFPRALRPVDAGQARGAPTASGPAPQAYPEEGRAPPSPDSRRFAMATTPNIGDGGWFPGEAPPIDLGVATGLGGLAPVGTGGAEESAVDPRLQHIKELLALAGIHPPSADAATLEKQVQEALKNPKVQAKLKADPALGAEMQELLAYLQALKNAVGQQGAGDPPQMPTSYGAARRGGRPVPVGTPGRSEGGAASPFAPTSPPGVPAEGKTIQEATGVAAELKIQRQHDRTSCGLASVAMVTNAWHRKEGTGKAPISDQTLRAEQPGGANLNAGMSKHLPPGVSFHRAGFSQGQRPQQLTKIDEQLAKGNPVI